MRIDPTLGDVEGACMMVPAVSVAWYQTILLPDGYSYIACTAELSSFYPAESLKH
jgi:hypothetical protein